MGSLPPQTIMRPWMGEMRVCNSLRYWLGSIAIRRRAALLLLLIVGFAVRVVSMPDNIYTYDEGQHLYYGHQILKLNSDRLEGGLWVSEILADGWRAEVEGRELKLVKGSKVQRYEILRTVEGGWDVRAFEASKMPVSALNALPGKIASHFSFANRMQRYFGSLTVARFMTVLSSLLLGYLCFYWSQQVYGFGAGLFTLFLFAFEPNLIAHSQLITTDLYSAATMTLALYTSWRYSLAKDARHAAVMGVAVGLSMVAKYSAVFLCILIPVIPLLAESKHLIDLMRAQDGRAIRDLGRRFVAHGCLAMFVAVLVINAGYLFNRTLTPLHEYHFKSDLFQSIQSALSPARFLRVPLPYPYLQGLDLSSFEERTGFGYGRVYLLGQLRREGIPGYYFFAFLFKVPLAIQAFCLIGALLFLMRCKRGEDKTAELFMLVPLIFFVIYLSFFFRAQNGIRFLLIVFPCIFVFCGSIISHWSAFGRSRRVIILGLSSYLVISVFSYFPHYIPYLNELVFDRRFAYKVLADSNIDWGQSERYLAQYLKQYPETLVRPEKPVAGRIVVNVNHLTGIVGDPERYAWLRENFFPLTTIAHAYLVYNVSAEELKTISPYYRKHKAAAPAPIFGTAPDASELRADS
jgi:Dolichyl-phosphate-mannose-protein mannosyltransferase